MEKEIASQSLSMSGSELHSQLWKETDFHSRILGLQNLNFSFWYLICHTPIKFQLDSYELSTETDNTLWFYDIFHFHTERCLHYVQAWLNSGSQERGGTSAARWLKSQLPHFLLCDSMQSPGVFWAFVSTDITWRSAIAQTLSWNAPPSDGLLNGLWRPSFTLFSPRVSSEESRAQMA